MTAPPPSLPSPAELDRVCSGTDLLESLYQPIVDLRHGVVCGYEALSRFPATPGPAPQSWFEAAARDDMAPRLEALAIRHALARRASLPPGCFLSINVSPGALVSDEVGEELDRAGDLAGLVLEVTEQTPLGDLAELRAALALVEEHGAAVAVDDVGDGYATLRHVVTVRPQFVKLDRSLVTDIDQDESRAAAVEAVGAFADKIDARVIAEGIERIEELDALVRLGVPLGQGFLFGGPAPAMGPISSVLGEHVRAQQTVRQRGRGVRGLLERAPIHFESDSDADLRQLFKSDELLEWVPVLDDRSRPVAIAERPNGRLAEPELRPVMTIGAHEAPAAVARRAMTRPCPERFVPLAACDARGRYLALLRLERLVEELAAIPERYARGSRVRRSARTLHPAGT